MAGTFEHLHRVLTLLRVERGLQQNELATRAGVARAAMSRYETGKAKPTIDNLGKILDALQVSPVEFGEAVERVRQRVDDGVEPPSRRLSSRSRTESPRGAYLVLDLADFSTPGDVRALKEAVATARQAVHHMHGAEGESGHAQAADSASSN